MDLPVSIWNLSMYGVNNFTFPWFLTFNRSTLHHKGIAVDDDL